MAQRVETITLHGGEGMEGQQLWLHTTSSEAEREQAQL